MKTQYITTEGDLIMSIFEDIKKHLTSKNPQQKPEKISTDGLQIYSLFVPPYKDEFVPNPDMQEQLAFVGKYDSKRKVIVNAMTGAEHPAGDKIVMSGSQHYCESEQGNCFETVSLATKITKGLLGKKKECVVLKVSSWSNIFTQFGEGKNTGVIQDKDMVAVVKAIHDGTEIDKDTLERALQCIDKQGREILKTMKQQYHNKYDNDFIQ